MRDEVEDDLVQIVDVIGDFVVFETLITRKPRTQVVRITRIFEVGEQLEVLPYLVPAGERYGPWTRRPWHPEENKVIIAKPEVLCDFFAGKSVDSGKPREAGRIGHLYR